MSYKERNDILFIEEENKDAIYVSYPCADDGEHDYILAEDIEKVSIMPNSIEVFDWSTCQKKQKTVSFEIKLDDETNKLTKVFIFGCIDEHVCGVAEMELQAFVDELAQTIYDDNSIENSFAFKSKKEEVIEETKRGYFIKTGNAAIGFTFDFAGKAINDDGEALMIINSIGVAERNNTVHFILNDCVSYMPLKEMDMPKIEFLTTEVKLLINNYTISSSIEGMIKSYEIIPSNMSGEETGESSTVENITITDTDLYIDECAKHLKGLEEIFEHINESNGIDNLFDDFEF